MAKIVKRLTVREVETLGPGRHHDGAGLYLSVSDSGARSWLYIYRLNNRRRAMGLGACSVISLADARDAALEAHKLLTKKIDPLDQRQEADRLVAESKKIIAEQKAKDDCPTFGTMAAKLIKAKSGGWRSDIHKQQWTLTLATHAAALTNLPVNRITKKEIIAVLTPVYNATPETASRLRGRIESVLDYATVHGHIDEDRANPARWKGNLEFAFTKRKKTARGHHAAMPYKNVPEFVARLRGIDTVGVRALEYVILCASRTGEVLGAKWNEFDEGLTTWTIPKNRMKAEIAHRVPISDRAREILEEMKKLYGGPNAFVFPGQIKRRGLGSCALGGVLRRIGVTNSTVHGFRSSFRDWCAEVMGTPSDVAEACLAHATGGDVELSYKRSDFLEQRRPLMQQWADHCIGKSNVIPMKRKGTK
jgi:integrase